MVYIVTEYFQVVCFLLDALARLHTLFEDIVIHDVLRKLTGGFLLRSLHNVEWLRDLAQKVEWYIRGKGLKNCSADC